MQIICPNDIRLESEDADWQIEVSVDGRRRMRKRGGRDKRMRKTRTASSETQVSAGTTTSRRSYYIMDEWISTAMQRHWRKLVRADEDRERGGWVTTTLEWIGSTTGVNRWSQSRQWKCLSLHRQLLTIRRCKTNANYSAACVSRMRNGTTQPDEYVSADNYTARQIEILTETDKQTYAQQQAIKQTSTRWKCADCRPNIIYYDR